MLLHGQIRELSPGLILQKAHGIISDLILLLQDTGEFMEVREHQQICK